MHYTSTNMQNIGRNTDKSITIPLVQTILLDV